MTEQRRESARLAAGLTGFHSLVCARALRHWLVAVAQVALFGAMLIAVAAPSAFAVDAIKLNGDADRVEITPHAVVKEGQGDTLRVNTAPGLDGVVRQMLVRANTAGTNPTWMVFALRNVSDKPVTRWITARRYHLIGSQIMWPDLDSRRIEALTPSVGFLPQQVLNDYADIYRVTIEPGQTITYVAELVGDRARIAVWEPHAYELQALNRQLFNGIILGIVGVLGMFLTAVFVANHRAIFPAAALVAWCTLGYLCVDFGFWHKLLQLRAEDNAVYRAATEAAIAASVAIFLHAFLRLGSWHGFFRMLSGVWIVAQLALVFIAVLDPRLASTFARLSFGAIGGVGALLTLFLALRGQTRALFLIPTWILFLVWVFGAAVTVMGQLHDDVVVSYLVVGLTVIVGLIGFTVMQFAFGSSPTQAATTPNEQSLRSLAVDGAGAAVWEWHARRDEIRVSPVVDMSLGYNHGELSTKVENFIGHLHPADQERLRVLLTSISEDNGGVLHTDFRIRHADNSYRWFELEASSIRTSDRNSLRCVGLLRDVTDQKRAHARLLHDAVHDSLTGLPNRELFLDRLRVAMNRAGADRTVKPAILFIDLDKFKSANASFGLIVGDSLLLTVARRLSRHLGPQDTLGRVGGDQFAVLLPEATAIEALPAFAEQVRRSLRAPIHIAGQDIVLTAAMGIAVFDGHSAEEHDLLKDAEIAMYRAKRAGADQVVVFRAAMRSERDDRVRIESDLRKAIDKRQLTVLYQPIIYLSTEELAGFEALVRWEHPQLGLLNPAEFVPVAEESDLIVRLGSHVLTRAVEQAARWQDELPRSENPVFVSVNVSSRQLFRQDLIQEIRHIIGKAIVPDGVLRLEVTESLVMENPERATEILESMQVAGAGLAMDDFGTGYSSLAYLQRFPFDTIKIDRDLIQAAAEDESGRAIVRSIVALAHELGKNVIAEGVEAPEDVAFLRSIGCSYAQGFYYGEPMTERAALDLVRTIRKTERKLQGRRYFGTKTKPAEKTAAADGSAKKRTERKERAARQGTPSGKTDAPGRDGPPTPPGAGDRPQERTGIPEVGTKPPPADRREGSTSPPLVGGPANAKPSRMPESPPVAGANGAHTQTQRPTPPAPPKGGASPSAPPTRPPPSLSPSIPSTAPPHPANKNGAATPSSGQPTRPPPPPSRTASSRPPDHVSVTPLPARPQPSSETGGAKPPPSSAKPNGGNAPTATGPASPPSAAPPAKSPQDVSDGLLPDFKTLPPGIRSSLEKLAGVSLDDDDPDSDEDAPIEKKPRKRRRG
jgi:diguanylate cyclase (GGDEF)-like protein/PAS domain S-box-containing protein